MAALSRPCAEAVSGGEQRARQAFWIGKEHDEHAERGREELPARRQEDGGALDESRADDRPRCGAEPADRRCGEHRQADGNDERALEVGAVD